MSILTIVARYLHCIIKKTGIYYIIMRQIYYVIRTLLRGRSSNVVKVISLGLGLTMSILLFARVAFEQSLINALRIMKTYIKSFPSLR